MSIGAVVALPMKLIMRAKNTPIHSPEPAPLATALPQLMRPVMRSTCRRSVPTIDSSWTGNPPSDSESTACCACA